MNIVMAKKHDASAQNVTQVRLRAINSALIRGDKTRIAKNQGVTRVWVSNVLRGTGTSEPVMQAAEELIRSRDGKIN